MKENTNFNTAKPIGLSQNILTQELDKELLLYDLSRDKVFCLNETSSIIWNLCDGENSVEDIRRKVSIKLKTNIGEEMIWLALDKLKENQLLSNHQEVEINFNNLSRREVIRKAGLSTMIALPLILSIVSPNAAAAASTVCETLTGCVCNFALVCNVFGAGHVFAGSCTNTFCSNPAGPTCQCLGPLVCLDATFAVGNCGTV